MKDLELYLNPICVPIIRDWIKRFHVKIVLTKMHKTRMGVFIPKSKGLNLIRINRDHNRYRFLITLVHELAHASIWQQHLNSVRPHGDEWKQEFSSLMQPFLNETFFDKDVLNALTIYLKNPLSSTSRDVVLSELLMNHDKCKKNLLIKNLNDGDIFKTLDGRLFKRISKLRKNYRCVEVSTNIEYRFPPLIEIVLL